MEKQLIYKRFDIDITEENKRFSETFELDKNVTAVVGLLLTSDKEDIMYFRGSQKITINSEEIVPEGYESRLLMTGLNVPPNKRFYETCPIDPGNGKVSIEYQDNPDGRTWFETHRVSLYLACEIEVS